MCYYIITAREEPIEPRNPLRDYRVGGRKEMDEMKSNLTEALLRAILELIEKCDSLEELRESIKKIMGE